MVTKARQLAEFIANADVDSDEIATGAVSASKLADTLDLSSKTIVMPDVAAFNITSGDVGIGTASPSANLHVESTTDASIRVKNTLNSASTSRHIELYNNDETGSLKLTVGRSGAGGGGAISTSNQMEFQTNGSERMRITSGGRVGIKNTGTDISGTSLDDVVIGAGTTVAGLVLDGGASNDTAYGFANAGTKVGRIQYINSSNSMVFQTDNANRMAIDGSGNVGIGTTSPAESLDIAGGSIRIGNSKIRHSGSGGSWDMAFETYSGGYFERMRIDSVGNVGVGTTSPDIYSFGGKILSVNGGTSYTNLVLAGDTNTGIAFGTSSARLGQITMDSTNGLTLYSQGTGNGQTMTLNRSGNVGIGTTSPTTNLTIGMADLGSAEIDFRAVSYSRLGIIKVSHDSGTAESSMRFHTRTGGNEPERMRITSSGKVGIGTTSPNRELEIKNDAPTGNTGIKIHNNSASNAAILELEAGRTSDGIDVSQILTANLGNNITNIRTQRRGADGGEIAFWTSAAGSGDSVTQRMVIDHNGNVGIGTTSPGRHLDINGPDIVSVRIRSGNQSAYAGMEFTDEISTFSQIGYIRHTHSDANTATHTGQSGNAAFLIGTTENDTVIGFNSNMSSSSAGTNRGSIKFTSSGTTYNTTSDLRLKENIKPISDGKEKLLAMKPKTFNFIEDENKVKMHGFIAQEMKDIIPEAVSNTKDPELMMSMDYGRITPVIVAALQDALKEIEQLKTRINELEDK